MRLLAFETSAKAASVAVLQNGMLLGEYFQNSGQTHSRTLMQMAEDILVLQKSLMESFVLLLKKRGIPFQSLFLRTPMNL